MSTDEILRLLLENGDPQAVHTLRRKALREGDRALFDYTTKVTENALRRLSLEIQDWRDILNLDDKMWSFLLEREKDYPSDNGPFLVLFSYGTKKISMIRNIRRVTRLGLRESKEIADNVPSVLFTNLSRSQAEEAIKDLSQNAWGTPLEGVIIRWLDINKEQLGEFFIAHALYTLPSDPIPSHPNP